MDIKEFVDGKGKEDVVEVVNVEELDLDKEFLDGEDEGLLNQDISLEDKKSSYEGERLKRADKIYDGVITKVKAFVNYEKFLDAMKGGHRPPFFEEQKDKPVLVVFWKTTNAPEVAGVENWEAWDDFFIPTSGNPKSKLIKLVKRYLGKVEKFKPKDLVGVKVKIITNDKGYGKIKLE